MKLSTEPSVITLLILTALLVLGMVWLAHGSSTINIGTDADFAILGASTVTNTGTSVINGDLGLYAGTSVTGFPPGILNGTQHVADAQALQAQNDLTIAYNDILGQVPLTIPTELGGSTLVAGTYDSESGTFGITGTVTLDGQNDPTSVFVFKMASTLTTAGASEVKLINGAQACNIFWQVGSASTLGTFSTFKGNILSMSAVTLTTGANVEGRVLVRNGAVTSDSNTITKAVCEAPPIIVPTTTVDIIPPTTTEDVIPTTTPPIVPPTNPVTGPGGNVLWFPPIPLALIVHPTTSPILNLPDITPGKG